MLIALDPTLMAAQQQAHAAELQVYVAIAQAFLTIIAIGVAIAVPAWQFWRGMSAKARDQFIEGRELANVILPALKDWSVRVAVLAGRARAARIAEVYYTHESTFEVPRIIDDQIGRLHLLGEAALPLQDAIHLSKGGAHMWDAYDDAARGNTEGELATFTIRDTHNKIYRMKGLLLVSSLAIERLFDEKVFSLKQPTSRSTWDYSEEVGTYVRNDKLGESDNDQEQGHS